MKAHLLGIYFGVTLTNKLAFDDSIRKGVLCWAGAETNELLWSWYSLLGWEKKITFGHLVTQEKLFFFQVQKN